MRTKINENTGPRRTHGPPTIAAHHLGRRVYVVLADIDQKTGFWKHSMLLTLGETLAAARPDDQANPSHVKTAEWAIRALAQ